MVSNGVGGLDVLHESSSRIIPSEVATPGKMEEARREMAESEEGLLLANYINYDVIQFCAYSSQLRTVNTLFFAAFHVPEFSLWVAKRAKDRALPYVEVASKRE